MRQKYWTRISRVLFVFAVIATVTCIPTVASASCITTQQSCSTSYGVSQTGFSSGSVDQCPLHTGSTYCANASVGDLSDGNTVGSSYQSNAGTPLTTNRAPYIAFNVGGVSTDLGTLSSSTQATVNANFTVQTYLAGGYIVQVAAKPPHISNGHILATPGSATTPVAGTEMFGMNLISNTSNPSGGVTPYGANPQCSPSASFCPSSAMLSSVTSNYNQNNKYYYPGSGTNYVDTIASANTSTGSVSYTVSYVYDISTNTPPGTYVYNGIFVATSTY
jgi:hypothetical protein